MQPGTDARTLIALMVTVFFWASAFAGIRAALESYSPGHLVLLRFLVASAILGGYALIKRMRLPEKQDLGALVIIGFVGITVYHVALTFGSVSVTAGSASLIIGSTPIFAAIFATTVLRECLKIWGWIGILISFAGVVLVVLGEGTGVKVEPGGLIIVLAAIATSLYYVLQKPYLQKYTALELATYAIWIGTLFMFVFLPGLDQAFLSGLYLKAKRHITTTVIIADRLVPHHWRKHPGMQLSVFMPAVCPRCMVH